MTDVEDFIKRSEDFFNDLKVTLDVNGWRTQIADMERKKSVRGITGYLRNMLHNRQTVLQENIRAIVFKKLEISLHRSAQTFATDLRLYNVFALDHCTYCRRVTKSGNMLVIISQPYGYDKEQNIEQANVLGAEFIDLEKWGWYYPTQANCFAILFPREAVMRMRKKRLKNNFHL